MRTPASSHFLQSFATFHMNSKSVIEDYICYFPGVNRTLYLNITAFSITGESLSGFYAIKKRPPKFGEPFEPFPKKYLELHSKGILAGLTLSPSGSLFYQYGSLQSFLS